jgi:hypothetical protein
MGIDAWADYQLSWYMAKSSGTCAGCGKNGKPTWAWGPKSQDFCAVCWHKVDFSYFRSLMLAQGDVRALPEGKRADEGQRRDEDSNSNGDDLML